MSESRSVAGSLKRRATEPLRKPGPVKKAQPITQTRHALSSAPPAAEHDSPPSRAGPPPGHCELNPFMTQALNAELQDVMTKVWQALPDNPNTEAEKHAVERLKADTGDDIVNVLGLNVAKRLLNIFNPLNVKIQFSNIPQRAHLRSFLKKYSFISFKRVERTTKTFAATLKTIQDFDRLCGASDLHCGSSKLTISPSYKFTHCPSKLKAIEKLKSNKERLKNQEANDIKIKTRNTAANDSIKSNLKAENLNTKTNPKTQSSQALPQSTPLVKKETNVNSNEKANIETRNMSIKQNTPTTNTKPVVQNLQTKAAAKANPEQNLRVKQSTVTTSQVALTANKPKEQRPQVKPAIRTSQQAQKSQVKSTVDSKPQVGVTLENKPLEKKLPLKPSAQDKPQGQITSPQVKPTVNTKTIVPNATAKLNVANEPRAQCPQATPTTNKCQAQNSQGKTNNIAKPNTVTKLEVQKPQVQPGQKSEVKPAPKAQVKPAVKTEVTPVQKSQVQPAQKSEVKTTPKAQVKPALKAEINPVQKSQVQPKQKSEVKPALKTQVKAVQNSPVKPAQKSQLKPAQKSQEKNVPAKKLDIKPKPKPERKSYKHKDDFEELDDHDILALMSEGIVLDECSGSDNE